MLPDVMRGRSNLTPEAAEIEYLPSDDARPLDLGEVFPTKAPLELDLGCGDGSFLAALAAQHPERNFLGIERLLGRVCTACRKIATRRLTNARILRVDIGSAVSGLVPAASVQVCHVMFPDPWPKRRHHRRRTVTAEFLKGIARILAPEGVVRLTTDDAPYFEQMRQAAASVPELIESPTGDDVPLPRSTFEQRFVELGLPVYRLVLRKVSPER
jgi:tRNA (guanine-N7-)-methyltransferase